VNLPSDGSNSIAAVGAGEKRAQNLKLGGQGVADILLASATTDAWRSVISKFELKVRNPSESEASANAERKFYGPKSS
jgi:hypothetical protein